MIIIFIFLEIDINSECEVCIGIKSCHHDSIVGGDSTFDGESNVFIESYLVNVSTWHIAPEQFVISEGMEVKSSLIYITNGVCSERS